MRWDLCRMARHLLLLFAIFAVACSATLATSPNNDGSRLLVRSPGPTTQPTFTTLIKRVLLPVSRLEKRDLECRKIHKPKYTDKCAFVRENCEDEEVGYFDYLALYYCNFGDSDSLLKGIPMTIMITWMTVLFTTIGIAASDFFCINLSTISTILGMSQSLAGVTFLAFGNGSPDVFSTFAAMKINSGSLAVGELVGAASFITAVVAGSMAIVRPFTVAKKSFVRDVVFFMLSVSLGIYFLYDGRILLWECVAMVGLYASYVVFVVGWHWYAKRQKKKKIIEIRTRGHYTDVAEEEELEEEEEASMGVQRGPQLTLNTDFSALERNEEDVEEDEESDDDRIEREEFAELSSNMRLGRPSIARHLTPVTPIRPSLIGALEFRSVLQSLNQDKNLPGRPIYLRSYSEESQEGGLTEPVIPRARHSRHHSTIDSSEFERHRFYPGTTHLAPPLPTGRARAVSVNDAAQISHGSDYFTRQTSQRNVPGATSPASIAEEPTDEPPLIALDHGTPLPTPPAFGNYQLQVPSSSHLAPPGLSPIASEAVSPSASPLLSSRTSSRDGSPSRYVDSPRPISRSTTGTGNGDIPIINLPPSATSTGSSEFITLPIRHPRLFKYWPYAVLPAPDIFFSTLFPTLYTFNEKNLWGKFLAIFSAVPIFLLTITLPIVDVPEEPRSRPPSRKPSAGSVLPSPASTVPTVSFDFQPAWMKEDNEPKDWNRWLVATQCITAPIFIVLAVCAGQIPLLFPILYALLSGLVALLLLLLLTRTDRPPKYRYLLCFVGFAVSICWISSIANEVVGVLKALGVILGISDAILGLTIFAVGNSLGDLVADITVARLGFPVMALSACFGGPMLNILLGIGGSGIYMTIAPASENYYQIEVSSTLMISAVTLLGTLLFLLVAVPMNNWRMTRGLGWALVGIWGVSTLVNVIVEVSGAGKRLEF
ncbi:hypothetical protein TWF281_000273 [Arthrobotrys megalospora]